MANLKLELIFVLCTLDSWTCCEGQSKIAKFSTPWNLTNPVFKKGDRLELVCRIEGGYSTFQINKQKRAQPLNVSQAGSNSLTVFVRSMSCDDLGTYECVIDSGQSMTFDVIVYDYSIFFNSATLAGPVFKIGDRLELVCRIEGGHLTFQINKQKRAQPLNVSQAGSNSLTVFVRSMSCDDLGTYECVMDSGERMIFDVIVYDCYPLPCEDEDLNTTIFVDVDQTVEFSLCVLVYHGMLDFIEFNQTRVKKNITSDWTWSSNESCKDPVQRIVVNVTRDRFAVKDYGALKIRVYAGAGTQFYLDYTVLFLPYGNQGCPRDVVVTDQGVSYITLSWTPEPDARSRQFFRVYFSHDNVTWYTRDVTERGISANITGLMRNTGYFFKVVSSNEDRFVVNEFPCQNTVFNQTLRGSGDTRNMSSHVDSRISLVLIILPISFVVLFFVVIAVLVACHKARARRQTSEHGRDGSESTGRVSLLGHSDVSWSKPDEQVHFVEESNSFSEAEHNSRPYVPLDVPPPLPKHRPPHLPVQILEPPSLFPPIPKSYSLSVPAKPPPPLPLQPSL